MNQYIKNSELPFYPESYWIDSANLKSYPKCNQDIKVDVAIVGGGITGITTAYLLKKEGLKVALLDAGKLLSGTTGHTTAKITTQHGVLYSTLINKFGTEKAKLYYHANNEALHFLKNAIKEKNIDCDFTEEDAYVYAVSQTAYEELKDEYDAYEDLGIPGEYLTSLPINIEVKSALVIRNQGQFHPLKYSAKLLEEIDDGSNYIFENTQAVDIQNEKEPMIITKDGFKISCNKVIIATHYPFYDGNGFYFSRLHGERSYILAAKADNMFTGGMYISADKPTRSLRLAKCGKENLILIGGEGHRTGHGENLIDHYKALEGFGKEVFDIKEVPYRWSAQDYYTIDEIPYIGNLTSSHKNIFVATGFRKWGMTNGTAAAHLLKDLVLEKSNPYAELYDPSRPEVMSGAKTFITQNTIVAKDLIQSKFEGADKEIEDLDKDEGAVVIYNGKKIGVYKDPNGLLHKVDTTCTHMGCELNWNDAERTWDCPCHNSRFSYDGEVIEGPAQKPLKKIED